ncbi:GRB10-interacting GYF protein 2 [Varanus komodoensis]|nr:GRB10-interacting GYF protein 2 [Varanus komodoensis]
MLLIFSGPFSNQEMTEWFQAGYFTMSLLVKRACDESFQPLGDIMKMWGRVPFAPCPPHLHMGELDQERLTRQQEFTAMYQMQHLQYQQFLLQQQYAQVMAQQQKAALSSQQQQQLALLLQQFQALKIRKAEQNMVPPVTRSVSVPDTGSIWELQSAAPQATVWEGSSVWDLPIDTAAQGPALEQLQQLEKAKAAKLEQERREAELRAKREEEERKRQEEIRRQQEELIRRQEEERKRREEEELARRKQEEALRRQREQEIALRRQREEEERQQQEEALRRLEERRREEEERRQREEVKRRNFIELAYYFCSGKEEEAAKWAREEEAKRQLEENRLRMEEEAARQRHEEEERKRKELELQRQKEIMRQRQQQQEALRRLQQQQQQQQLAQMKLPSSSTWGQQANSRACQSQTTLSLAEIQKLEEERERQLQEEQRRQQHELMKALQQQQQQQQQKLSGWGNVAKPAASTKSLLEIQQEEARQMQKQQQQHQQQQNRSRSTTVSTVSNFQFKKKNKPLVEQHSNLHTSIGNSVWGSVNTNPSSQWASDLVSSIWSNADTKNSNLGFWDDAVKEVGPRNATNKNKSNASISLAYFSCSFLSVFSSYSVFVWYSKSIGVTSRQNKKVEEEEKLLKLFQGVNKSQDGFTQWCEQMLHALNTANNLDVPTFVSFLKEVESPYEVHDYIRAYLGDTPEAKEFAKQFLERRAKQKANQQRQQQVHFFSLWRTFISFSVNASSERLNMGEIETLDDY